VKRIEDDAMEKAHAFRVGERDRELIKEARERRLREKTDRARKAAEEDEVIYVYRRGAVYTCICIYEKHMYTYTRVHIQLRRMR